MVFTLQRLAQDKVLELLREAENSFTPPLSCNIPYTLEEYATKLSEHAFFILCKEDEIVIAFTAFYLNKEGGFAYIPQIWVSDDHQCRGIGSSMIDELVKSVGDDINAIRLEVRKNNGKAFSFYLKSGYAMVEEKNGKCLMEKIIKE